MALGTCIPDLVSSGKISKDRAEEATAIYNGLVLQYAGRFGRDAAESMATEQTLKALDRQLLQRKRQVLLQAKRQRSILDDSTRRYAGGKAGRPTGAAMMAHLVRDESAPYANVEYRWHNIKQTALATMYDLLKANRATMTGALRDKALLTDIVRELFGTDTGNLSAKEMADAWRQTGEFLRGRFNAAGGHIGKLEGWGLPQHHDSVSVGAVRPEDWIDEVMPMLDRTRMIDDDTGLPFSDEKLRLVLRDVYETIASDGWSQRKPGGPRGRSLGNRRAEHRFLHFKDADAWLAYNERFGGSDAYSAMMSHVDGMSRDIAMMEILGPNPTATVQWMKDVVAKEANVSGSLKDRLGLRSGELQIDAVFGELTGQNNRAGDRRLALFGSTIRNWQSATKLGSATLASFSDAGTQALTRAFNGLPAASTLIDYAKLLNPLSAEDRDFARRAGIIGDEYAGRIGQGGRMNMDESFGGRLSGDAGFGTAALERSAEVSRRLADGVMKVSGLNAWTVAGREAMGMEFMNAIASFAGRDFDKLDAPFARFLQRYGIDRDGWDRIRATPKRDWKGAQWIMPDDIADKALRDRLFEGILTETDFAVPTGGLRQRALVNAIPRGTVLGEIIRTGFQFKMFPLTVMSMHGQRMMAQSALHYKATYAAAFLGATTLTGAMAYQMAELSKGRDPRPMTDREFWWRAMLKGGGLGIYGDALENARSEYGQDIGDITKGPAWSTGQNIADLIIGKGGSDTDGDGDVGIFERKHDIGRFLQRETPGGSIWYIRAAYENLLIDTVSDWQDPEGLADKHRAMERKAEDSRQGLFIRPGAGLDGVRAPDFSNAFATGDDSGGDASLPN